MNTGYERPTDPFENAYVVDLMNSAIDAYRRQFDPEVEWNC